MSEGRFELHLDEAAGPARRIDDTEAHALVEQALKRMEPEAPVRERRARLSRAAAIGFGIVLASGSAAASYVALTRLVDRAAPPPAERPPDPRRARRSPVVVQTAPPAEAPTAAPNRTPPPRPIVDLAQANRLRAAGDWAGAHRAYSRLASTRSPEGRTASLSAAALELDHLNRPREALRRYAALAASSDRAIAEEAAWGLVECHRRLGDRAAESAALRAFVAQHPGSLLRARAEERLRAVGR